MHTRVLQVPDCFSTDRYFSKILTSRNEWLPMAYVSFLVSDGIWLIWGNLLRKGSVPVLDEKDTAVFEQSKRKDPSIQSIFQVTGLAACHLQRKTGKAFDIFLCSDTKNRSGELPVT